jgi:hypothetical protein
MDDSFGELEYNDEYEEYVEERGNRSLTFSSLKSESQYSQEEDTIETQESKQRMIIHIDLDCFFVQVEIQRNNQYNGKPIAVQQHQDIICVSYEGIRNQIGSF